MKKYFGYIVMAILLCGLSSCVGKTKNTSTSGLATVVCDDSFENIMDQEIGVFEYIYPEASIIPYYTNERAALDSLFEFKTKLVVIPRELTANEKQYIKNSGRNVKVNKIAVDAIALIVNPENPIEILSISEIAEILSGKVTDWNQLSPNKTGKISVVFDHEGSSVVKYMKDSLLNGGLFGPNVYAQKSNDEVFEAVQKLKGAIGIIGVSWINSDMRSAEITNEHRAKALEKNDTTIANFDTRVKVLKVRRDDEIEARKPYQAYIYDGSYPLFRSMYMVSTAANGSIAHGFYSFVTSFRGQKIIQMTGILPATIQPRMVNLN
ncbi:MAG: substrate-binding domain-containing protein [Muribaculaceae bacterium]|nr:substrate-binding domain-containing protein [Muribaculaceae bacterium]